MSLAVYEVYYSASDPSGRLRLDTLLKEEAFDIVSKIYQDSAKKSKDGVGMICSITQKKVGKR